jgi:hypothetical protein
MSWRCVELRLCKQAAQHKRPRRRRASMVTNFASLGTMRHAALLSDFPENQARRLRAHTELSPHRRRHQEQKGPTVPAPRVYKKILDHSTFCFRFSNSGVRPGSLIDSRAGSENSDEYYDSDFNVVDNRQSGRRGCAQWRKVVLLLPAATIG